MTPETPVIVDVRTGYRAITLNRPDKLNAFNEAMHRALRRAIDEAEADESCRALLITGAGRGFCTGQDLGDRLAKPGETVVLGGAQETHYNLLVRKLRALPFPVVAAVNGVAAGVPLEHLVAWREFVFFGDIYHQLEGPGFCVDQP